MRMRIVHNTEKRFPQSEINLPGNKSAACCSFLVYISIYMLYANFNSLITK